MADKVEKPKKQKSKAKPDEKGVLAALPSTRPERIGTRRATSAPAPKSTAATAASKAAATKPSAKPAAKPPATKAAAKPRATASRRKAAAPRTFEPTPAAEAAAGAADERAAGAVPRAETRRQRPQAVREGAPGMGTTTERPDPASSAPAGEQASPEHGRPSGVELVTTAVQAAGEITQIGLAIGGRLLKRAVDRLPKP
jgi:hypothetical protein